MAILPWKNYYFGRYVHTYVSKNTNCHQISCCKVIRSNRSDPLITYGWSQKSSHSSVLNLLLFGVWRLSNPKVPTYMQIFLLSRSSFIRKCISLPNVIDNICPCSYPFNVPHKPNSDLAKDRIAEHHRRSIVQNWSQLFFSFCFIKSNCRFSSFDYSMLPIFYKFDKVGNTAFLLSKKQL